MSLKQKRHRPDTLAIRVIILNSVKGSVNKPQGNNN